jgi:quercetin dioxygenase-like cupin family protein
MGDVMTPIGRLALISMACFAAASAAQAQPAAMHRTTLQEQAFPPPIYHTVTVKVVVDPGGLVPPHAHPGVEMAYVVEGHAVVTIAGQTPLNLSAGDSFSVPPKMVHSVRNAGPGALTLVSTYVVDKAQPLSSPAN